MYTRHMRSNWLRTFCHASQCLRCSSEATADSTAQAALNALCIAHKSQAAGLHSLQGHNRAFASSSDEEALVKSATLITMPQLSPNMTNGTVRKWLKQPGEDIETYDVIMEVDTDTLTEEAYKVGDFEGTVTMLVESQEDGVLADILVPEGKAVGVHVPLAVISESKEVIEAIQNSKNLKGLLDKHRDGMNVLTWQSYLKESKEGRKGCS